MGAEQKSDLAPSKWYSESEETSFRIVSTKQPNYFYVRCPTGLLFDFLLLIITFKLKIFTNHFVELLNLFAFSSLLRTHFSMDQNIHNHTQTVGFFFFFLAKLFYSK